MTPGQFESIMFTSPREGPKKGLQKTQRAPLEIIGHLGRVISCPPARFSFTELGDFIAVPYLWAIFLWSVFARRRCQIKDSLANILKLRLWHDLVVSFSTKVRVILFQKESAAPKPKSAYGAGNDRQLVIVRHITNRTNMLSAVQRHRWKVASFVLKRLGGHRLRRPKASVVECMGFQRDFILSENRMASRRLNPAGL